MSIGLLRGTVALERHDPEWETDAHRTIVCLNQILGNTAIDIQHIGSTSIRSICAKPIIDLVIGVSDFDKLLSENQRLAENGYLYRGQDHPDQHLYVCGTELFITHHIHAVIFQSDAWNNYVNMRDYLNCHSDEAEAYSAFKQSLAEQYPNDRKKYTAMKANLIHTILEKAECWRKSL